MTTSRFRGTAAIALVLALLGVTTAAHPMTIKGTVAGIETKRIQVRTGEEKKGETPAWFAIDAKTKILRGKDAVTFEKAQIAAGERVVVDADHRADGTMFAVDIHLAAK